MNIFKFFIENESFQLFRFFVVGGGATLIHLAIAALLIFLFPFLHIYAVNFISFLTAFLFSFLGHQYFTFKRQGSLAKFFSVSVLGFFLNNIVLTIGLAFHFPKMIAILIAVMSVPFLTYIVSKIWIFRGDSND
ncbi:GtrA family protein [Halomonas dongshanensis]|uniref:GtrA family protein n=1 Tax=Halomonas dongshanensis TaxID=2890835 RepID=A0ABT2EC06_9GAMM|nr:GtrA family protein [Halomonas dongshanensis]MCS2609039.1 GtrA family protein [Halomonas dongshanensis]